MNKGSIINLIISLLLLAGCSSQTTDKKPIVAVTIQPQKYIVDRIVGDLIDVVCAIPSGANPEEFDATPHQIREITSSDIYFEVGGLGFEESLLPSILKNAPNIKLVKTAEGIEPLSTLCHHGGEHHLHYDPHYWSSPKCVKVMAENIYNQIVELDAENSEYYTHNYNLFISEIDSIDYVLTEKLKDVANRQFAIFHPSLSYFARDYGLRQLSLEQIGKEMTPLTMQRAIEEAVLNGVTTVFIQNEFNPRQVETFAKEIDAQIVVINPLAYNFAEEIIKVADAITR